jgi:hypothetical protein
LAQRPEFEETCERYLLGELSAAESERFEEAYFADDALFEQFQAVKDELLDLYARGELPEEKGARFSAHFLSTAPRRLQFEETQNFIRAMTAVSTGSADESVSPAVPTPEKSSERSLFDFFNLRMFAWQITFAAMLLIASIVLVYRYLPPPEEQTALQATPSPTTGSPTGVNYNAPQKPDTADTNQLSVNTNLARNAASRNSANSSQSLANTVADPKPTPKSQTNREPRISPARIASIMLLPVASRDINEANTLRLAPDTRAVRLQLTFKNDDYRNYSAAVTTIEGSIVWQQKTLRPANGGANKSVTIQFAPALLRGQDYIVTLTGRTSAGQTEIIGEYYFRVERSPAPTSPSQTPTPEQ